MPNRRTVFFLSDRTGITAEMLGNSLLTQFEDFEFHRQTIPFVDSPEKVDAAIRQVNEAAARALVPRRDREAHGALLAQLGLVEVGDGRALLDPSGTGQRP